MRKKYIAFPALSMMVLCAAGQTRLEPLKQLQGAAIAYAKSSGRDEFSTPPTAGSALGSAFQYLIPLNSSRSTTPASRLSSGFYEYSDGTLITHLEQYYSPLDAFQPATVIALGSYTGISAFGRRMTVRKERVEKVGIEILNITTQNRSSSDPLFGKAFAYRAQVTGNEGRRLSRNLQYRITGHISRHSDGKSVNCKVVHGNPPTLKYPVEFTLYECTVAVVAERVELVDTVTGASVRTWRGEQLNDTRYE